MIRRIILSGACLSVLAFSPAFAQSSKNVIMANSPQDIALQEEIRKIRAYNAYVDGQIGIFDAPVAANPYAGKQIELFTPGTPHISYATTSGKVVEVKTVLQSRERDGSYRIIEGDTLYGLAKRNCVSVADIQNLNGLGDANIRLGQSLNLPASRCGAVATKASLTTQTGYVRKVMPVPTKVNTTRRNYAVLPKDTLFGIGKRYCISVAELSAHNGIESGKAIQPGQILRLPDTACQK